MLLDGRIVFFDPPSLPDGRQVLPLFEKLCFIHKYEFRGKQENNEYSTLNNQCRTMKNTSIRS